MSTPHPATAAVRASSDLDAWRALCRDLAAVGEVICAGDFPGAGGPDAERDRAEGFRHVLRLLMFATQWAVEFGDPDFPAFLRTTDDAIMFGGPSADNRNIRARVDGRGTYRIRGNVGTSLDVLFTATGGDMALGQTSVSHERSAARDLEVGEDGSVELIVSPVEQPGNWLPMAENTRRIQVRQILTDWSSQEPGWFDIERLDRPQSYPADLTSTRMSEMLAEIGRWVTTSTTYWNEYQLDLLSNIEQNTIQAPTPQEGGGLSIRYGFGRWRLQPEEALVVTFSPPLARYWSLQPYNLGWFEVLDYRNRQTTINNAQAVLEDGVVRVVISAIDPGISNWIDTAGHIEGQLIFRCIWADQAESVAPTCEVVPIDTVLAEAPVNHATIIRTRRTSVARRHRR